MQRVMHGFMPLCRASAWFNPVIVVERARIVEARLLKLNKVSVSSNKYHISGSLCASSPKEIKNQVYKSSVHQPRMCFPVDNHGRPFTSSPVVDSPCSI